MASTIATSSILNRHCPVEPGSSVSNQETAQAENNNALFAQSPARDADLRSSGPKEGVNAHNKLNAAVQSSHSITNSQAMIEIAASRIDTTSVSPESTHDEEQGARHSIYPEPPNHDNHDDLDPAALLESLASHDHTQAHNSNTAYGDQENHGYQNSQHHHANQFENDHFASLLQAAATAGQNQENNEHNHYESHSRDSQPLQEWKSHGMNSQHPQGSNTLKRKHSKASDDAAFTPNTYSSSQWNSRTRRRLTSEADDSALAREHAIWGPSDHESESEAPSQSYTPLSPSSARAAGVHSAAALFRKPTPASKKYTRPPMSKLFTSLEIGPEQFLHLQAAAKTYMLDPTHPDRYNCVGSKAKVDTDMVKLKLFGCVENFLEDEGWGEKCWGANAERETLPGQKKWRLKWPKTRNKIITSVTPLMRRMVTNERQRRYANETRSKEKGGKTMKPAAISNGVHEPENRQLPPEIDSKFADYHYSLAPDHDSAPLSPAEEQSSSTPTTSFRVVIICPESEQQVIQSATLVLPDHVSYDGILDYIRPRLQKSELAKRSSLGLLRIEALRVHLPAGLSDITCEQDWEDTLRVVQGTPWMQGLATVVVEVRTVNGFASNGAEQELRTEEHS